MLYGLTKLCGATLSFDDSWEALGHIQEGRSSVALVLDHRVLPCSETKQGATYVQDIRNDTTALGLKKCCK